MNTGFPTVVWHACFGLAVLWRSLVWRWVLVSARVWVFVFSSSFLAFFFCSVPPSYLSGGSRHSWLRLEVVRVVMGCAFISPFWVSVRVACVKVPASELVAGV